MIGASFHAIGLRSGSLDPLTVAYAAASGATDLAGIDKVIRYVRAESLLSNFVMYPMKSAQNAGTGTTVYPIGSLTSNVGTLTNGPEWTAGGTVFESINSEFMSIPDFLGSETVTCLLRTTVGALSAGNALISQYDTGANDRSWIYYKSTLGNEMWLAISDNGTDLARYGGGDSSASTDVCHVVKYGSDGSVQNYLDKTEQTLSINLGTARSSRNDSSVSVLLSAFQSSGSATSFANQTAKALAFLTGTVTTTQRETITDLINEL
jgi:hypothetical protein